MVTPINVKAVQEKIRKLQRLVEFAEEFGSDPEFESLLAEYSQKNGHAPKSAPVAGPRPVVTGESGSSKTEQRSAGPRGYFLKGVEDAIKALPVEFTTDDIQKHMESMAVPLRPKNPNISINDSLRTLEERGVVTATRRRGPRGRLIWRKLISAEESRTA